MVRITEDLLRKRAEHNELQISTLEEISLHQQNIEKIEHIDKLCRDLKILYLQSNLIPKIENVNRLKKLEYINLALNNVEKVENLEGCESLKKIDLTVNFVGELTSIECLKNSYNLQELFLTGNPCVNYEGYRQYVIATLPQLMYLDGKQISKSERITAIQQLDTVKPFILQQQKEYAKKRAQEKQEAEAKKEKKKQKTKSQKDKNPGFDGRWYTDINKEDLEKRKDIEKADEENEEDEEAAKKEDDYWDEEIPFTPESRIEMHEQMVEEEKKKEEGKKSGPHVPQREVRLQTDDGTILNVNEAKINFSLSDDEKSNALLLDVECYKHLDTSLLDVDVQPCYVKVVIKGKVLQLVLPEEVKPDSSSAKRSKTTGHLLVSMPKMKQVITAFKQSTKQEPVSKELSKNKKVTHDTLEVDPSKAKTVDLMVSKVKTPIGPYEGSLKKKVEERPNSEDFVDDPDVPPLI